MNILCISEKSAKAIRFRLVVIQINNIPQSVKSSPRILRCVNVCMTLKGVNGSLATTFPSNLSHTN